MNFSHAHKAYCNSACQHVPPNSFSNSAQLKSSFIERKHCCTGNLKYNLICVDFSLCVGVFNVTLAALNVKVFICVFVCIYMYAFRNVKGCIF